MMPIVFSIGPVTLYTFTMCLLLSWVTFSFFFWRHLRDLGVPEEYIFDMMFYGTLIAIIGSRLGFVLENPELFSGWKWIRVLTIWLQPGFTLYGALIPAIAILLIIAYQSHIRRGFVLDAVAKGFGPSYIIGALGALLGGITVGTISSGFLTVSYVGYSGRRYPVGLWEALAMIGIMIIVWVLGRLCQKQFQQSGIYALWFFFFFSIAEFGLEFLKESRVYWGSLHINQWILIVIFGEVVGLLFVKGGGKEWIGATSVRLWQYIRKGGGTVYAKFSKRHP